MKKKKGHPNSFHTIFLITNKLEYHFGFYTVSPSIVRFDCGGKYD